MSDDIKVGDRVGWTSSGGKSVGRVKKKLTKPIEIKGHHVAASPENPEFLVESDKGGQAAHKPASLNPVAAAKTKAASGKSKVTATKKSGATKSGAKKSVTKKSPAKKR